MPRKRAVTLFPEKPKPAKKGPKQARNFRSPADVEEYLESVMARGYGITEAIVMLLRLGRDVEEGAGDALPVLEKMARREGVPVGEMIGRLARKAAQRKVPK